MGYFVDTGILLRALDRKDPKFPSIRRALKTLRADGESLSTTTQNLREFWNVSTRPTSARGGYGRTVLQTARGIRILQRVFRIVPESPTSFTRWKELVELHGVIGVQVHDANLVAIMDGQGIGLLLTLNPGDFRRYPHIEAVTPDEILAAK